MLDVFYKAERNEGKLEAGSNDKNKLPLPVWTPLLLSACHMLTHLTPSTPWYLHSLFTQKDTKAKGFK